MNQVEQETVILNTAWGMIDGMVNWEMFRKQDLVGTPILLSKSIVHTEMFAILLTDFLSPTSANNTSKSALVLDRPSKSAIGVDRTFLRHLKKVCQNPQFGTNANDLSVKVERFAEWLEVRINSRDVNLSSIDLVADIEVERYKYIKMCGNIAKHNPTRLDHVIKELRELLETNGIDVEIHEAYMALQDFFDWFFSDIFVFHSNHIAEQLNDIRWHISEYLQHEYEQSCYRGKRFDGDYRFRIPKSIEDPSAQWMYWDLMNRVRAKPYMAPFVVAKPFKDTHHTER